MYKSMVLCSVFSVSQKTAVTLTVSSHAINRQHVISEEECLNYMCAAWCTRSDINSSPTWETDTTGAECSKLYIKKEDVQWWHIMFLISPPEAWPRAHVCLLLTMGKYHRVNTFFFFFLVMLLYCSMELRSQCDLWTKCSWENYWHCFTKTKKKKKRNTVNRMSACLFASVCM